MTQELWVPGVLATGGHWKWGLLRRTRGWEVIKHPATFSPFAALGGSKWDTTCLGCGLQKWTWILIGVHFNRAWYAWFTWGPTWFKKKCAMTLHGLLNSISASWLQKLWHACKRYIEIDLGCGGQAAIDRFSVFWPSRSLPQGKACWRWCYFHLFPASGTLERIKYRLNCNEHQQYGSSKSRDWGNSYPFIVDVTAHSLAKPVQTDAASGQKGAASSPGYGSTLGYPNLKWSEVIRSDQ